MRRSWLLFGLTAWAGAARSASAQSGGRLPDADRTRVTEAAMLAATIRDNVWPGWDGTAMPVLLVTDSVEYLVGRSEAAPGFTSGPDTVLGYLIGTRPRRLPPTLLATFPVVDGAPTIVIGSPERTGRTSSAWIVTLLHEHFHQWQYTQPGYYAAVQQLDLAGDDSTGQWMLDYPFPYDSAPVRGIVEKLGTALADALAAAPARRTALLGAARAHVAALRSALSPADRRYLEFQLWQEGVARYVEYAVLAAAARRADSTYARASVTARRALDRELRGLDVKRDRRVVFYPLGAAMALLLDRVRPGWKRVYSENRFELTPLLFPNASP